MPEQRQKPLIPDLRAAGAADQSTWQLGGVAPAAALGRGAAVQVVPVQVVPVVLVPREVHTVCTGTR